MDLVFIEDVLREETMALRNQEWPKGGDRIRRVLDVTGCSRRLLSH